MKKPVLKTSRLVIISILLFSLTACSLIAANQRAATPAPAGQTITPPAAPQNQPGTSSTGVPAAEETPTAAFDEPEEPAADDSGPSFAAGPCPFDIPNGADVRCGTVTVPENRQNPGGERQVRLPVAIFASTSPNPAPDPVVYLAGGPGGFALELIQFTYRDNILPFLADRDYIVFDQRGTGYAEPSLACPETFAFELEMLDDDLPEDVLQTRYLEVLAGCRSRLEQAGIDLAAYNSAENAADVDAIRQALGYERWNLLGVSYGSRLAQTVMRDYPEGVRSVILDSPYPLEVDLQEAIPGHMTRAFRVFFDGCAADAACAAAYPDLEAEFYRLVNRLNTDPITFPIVYFLSGNRYTVNFNGDDLIDILFQSLYSNEIFPLMPGIIFDVKEGRTDRLALLFTTLLINEEFISTGMYRSVQCREELAFSDREAVAAAAASDERLADYFANWEFAYNACAIWPSGRAAAIENEPVVSEIPTLILTGEYDPITPPAWGELVSGNLVADYLVPFPGIGHGATSSGSCPLSVALTFLRRPDQNPANGCLAEMRPPAFLVPGGQDTEEITLIPFSAEISGVSVNGVVPEGWEETLPGTFSRRQNGLDQTALVFQVIPVEVVTPEELVAFFLDQLSAEREGVPDPYVDAGDREWSIVRGRTQGLPLTIATVVDDRTVLAVILLMNEGEDLAEPVLLPALDGFRLEN